MSAIYIIPTPIGNLGDITLRSLDTLKNVDRVYAEDTRVTQKLLKHYDIKQKLYSYHQHNEHKIVDKIIEDLIREDIEIAIVSDAGTPGISDPGFLLINRAKENNISCFCFPGPTALIPAIVQSGFPTDEFYFAGFLPHKKGRKKKLSQLMELSTTVILYESPYRLMKLLKELKDLLPNQQQICVSREITKVYEENIRGSAQEVFNYFENKKIKGEIVLVIEKATKTNKQTE